MPTFNNIPIPRIEYFDKALVNLKIIVGKGPSLFDNTDKIYGKMNYSHQTWTLQIMILGQDWVL